LTWERVDLFVDRHISAGQCHVWPFAHSFPVDVRCLIMDRRYEVPMHRPDHLEVVIFESGELGYEVEGHACTVRKNDVIVAGDRIRHRCLPAGVAQHAPRSVVLSFLPSLLHAGAPLGDDLQYLMPFTLLEPSFPNVIPAGTGLWRELIDFVEKIRRELPGESERSRLAIKTYLRMILLSLVNHYSHLKSARAALENQQGQMKRLAPLMAHIEQHYEKPIRVNDAARMCAMSECSFMQLFREVTGQSFVPYLNRFRIARAQELLASTTNAISEISLETGFCNQSYFGVIFRRMTGMTPLEYRLHHAKPKASHLPVV